MTFQPPPPPPGENPPTPPPPPPPTPPPGQWGPAPGSGQPTPGGGYPAAGGGYPAPRAGFDPKTVNPLDWAILGVGFLTLIFSFFSFYTASASGGGLSASESWSAWHDIFGGGFFGWIGMIFAVLATIALALEVFSAQVKFAIATRLLVLYGFALGAICEILAIFIHPKFASESVGGFHASFGHGFSFWIILILTIAGTGLALMRAQQTNTQMPGPLANLPNIGAKGPQGGLGGPPPPPPPPPGYGPPTP
jgi:hypothetical protein